MNQVPKQSQINEFGLKEVSVRLQLVDERTYYGSRPMGDPAAAAVMLRDLMKRLDREWLCVVNLDTRNKPINFNIVSIGNVNSSIADLSNIFKAAILSNASQIMLAHNHPSGDCSPSSEDYNITETALNAGNLMRIPVVDHLIFGAGTDNYFSFREHYSEMFGNDHVDPDFLDALRKFDRQDTRNVAEQKPAETLPKKTSIKDIKAIASERRKASGGPKTPRKRNGKE